MDHLDKKNVSPCSPITILRNKAAQHILQMNRNNEMENSSPARQTLTQQGDNQRIDPSAPALSLSRKGDHFISACPHHGFRVFITRPLTDQSSTYCTPNCIRLHVANIFPNWTSGLRSHLLINSATNTAVKFTGNKRQFEEMIESNQMLKLFKYVQFRSRQKERKTSTTKMSVKGPKKQLKRLKCQNGENRGGEERIASTSGWRPLLLIERRKGDTQKSEKSSKKAQKLQAVLVNLFDGSTSPESESNSEIGSTGQVGQTRSPPVMGASQTGPQHTVPPKLGSANCSSSVDCHSLTEKVKISNCEQRNQPERPKLFRSSVRPSDPSLPANKRQCLSREMSVKTALVPAELARTQDVKMEPNQERTLTMATSTSTLALSGEPLGQAQPNANSLLKVRSSFQPVAPTPPPAASPLPPEPKGIVWEGIFERCPGKAFPIVAYPLTPNATSHWFQNDAFLSKDAPFTNFLQMSECIPLVKMFALLQGVFQLAVVHFALPSKASSTQRSKVKGTFNYLYGKKKAGCCYRIEKAGSCNGYLTHLFVYALGREDTVPELLQDTSIALPNGRTTNMLLGLLVSKESEPTHLPTDVRGISSERETQAPPKAVSIPVEFLGNLLYGDTDGRIQTHGTLTLRRDPKLDPRLSASAAVAMHPLPQPQSQLLRQFSLTPSIPKGAHVPRQESQLVHEASQLPVEPVNEHDSDEEINCLNAAPVHFRQTPTGQRIPVLLNGVHEQPKNLRLNSKF